MQRFKGEKSYTAPPRLRAHARPAGRPASQLALHNLVARRVGTELFVALTHLDAAQRRAETARGNAGRTGTLVGVVHAARPEQIGQTDRPFTKCVDGNSVGCRDLALGLLLADTCL